MSARYNENDPFAARWLRNLVAAGNIAHGEVDERDIRQLAAADVAGPGQRHFFAGIAGWSLALRLAGVRDDADIWTGSCPCQPFSDAGRRGGVADDRHLWPTWFGLIRECRPAVVLGEQVASRAGLGWLDAVFADLEGAGYACAAADLPAASVGAPHKRQRMFFVAYADGQHRRLHAAQREPGRADAQAERSSEAGGVGYTSSNRGGRNAGTVSRSQGEGEGEGMPVGRLADVARLSGEGGERAVGVADADHDGRGSRRASVADDNGSEQPSRLRHAGWSDCDWIPCSDGVSRPVEPGTHPLVNGLRGRVGLLRGYGNAIVPQVAAAFIKAAMSAVVS